MQPDIAPQPSPQFQAPSPQFQVPPQPQPTPMPMSAPKKKRPVLLIILCLLLLAAAGGLGYMYYTEQQAHTKTKQELSDANATLEKNAEVIRTAELLPGFSPVIQQGADTDCSGTAQLFKPATSVEKNSDGSIKKYFGVMQYVCYSGSGIVTGTPRFSAAQSYDGTKWEFTYGSSTTDPLAMPKYIYSTDSAMYDSRYPGVKPY